MNIFYSDSPLALNLNEHSIFLVGPTPRSLRVESWRPTAISILNKLNYKGQIIYPERKVKLAHINYDTQVEWEHYGLENSTVIVCWLPRNLRTMPAFTTNVEFGRYVNSRKLLYGRPDNAPKNRYLDWLYKKYNNKPIYNNLPDLLEESIKYA